MSKLQKYMVVYLLVCVVFSLLESEKLKVSSLDYPTKKRTGDNGCIYITSKPQVAIGVENNHCNSLSLENQTDNNNKKDTKNDQQVVNTSLQEQDIQGIENETNLYNTISDMNYNSIEKATTVGSGFSSSIKLLRKRLWNRLDAMDKTIVSSTLPLMALTSVIPLMQCADLFWVNQLGDTLAVSSQSAANMVYQFSFGLFSFLPSVTATLVSKNYANNDLYRMQDIACRAVAFAVIVSSIISMMLFTNPSRCLGAVLKEENPALMLSTKYLRIHSLSLIPQMLSYVCFSIFRGMMDYKPCLKISFISNIMNIVSTPLLIHVFKFGVVGSAISALFCDSFTAICYIKLMIDKKILIWEKVLNIPTWKEVSPLVKGSALQARSIAMHFTNLMVARKIQTLDDSGVAPAAFALAMQTFFTGGVVIFALGMATQTLYPNAVAKCEDDERRIYSKILIKRLLGRGFFLGSTISVIQMLFIPFILRATPNVEVRQAALFPIVAVIVYQGINGVVCVGEGIIVGDGKFATASIISIIASLGYMGCLQIPNLGINGVFLSLGVFTVLRLAGFFAFSPSLVNSYSKARISA
mmetsp:Transcript_44084/g.49771  ORF Transcript_44084/g.49771 Transcript_44084/m.49771 type:complete len:582 (+) Transcript_44084:187-1932(+)